VYIFRKTRLFREQTSDVLDRKKRFQISVCHALDTMAQVLNMHITSIFLVCRR